MARKTLKDTLGEKIQKSTSEDKFLDSADYISDQSTVIITKKQKKEQVVSVSLIIPLELQVKILAEAEQQTAILGMKVNFSNMIRKIITEHYTSKET